MERYHPFKPGSHERFQNFLSEADMSSVSKVSRKLNLNDFTPDVTRRSPRCPRACIASDSMSKIGCGPCQHGWRPCRRQCANYVTFALIAVVHHTFDVVEALFLQTAGWSWSYLSLWTILSHHSYPFIHQIVRSQVGLLWMHLATKQRQTDDGDGGDSSWSSIFPATRRSPNKLS